jgi:diguanylate cyclase (GGDEF)-like protein
MLIYRDFRDIANRLLEIVQQSVPLKRMEYYAQLAPDKMLSFLEEDRYMAVEQPPPEKFSKIFGMTRLAWEQGQCLESCGCSYLGQGAGLYCLTEFNNSMVIVSPVFAPDRGVVEGLIVMYLEDLVKFSSTLDQVLEQACIPLQVAVEREIAYQKIERERDRVYRRSIRDPLTNLFTRTYMNDVVNRLCDMQDRDPEIRLVATMLDLDYFKKINDTYGHDIGDLVLQNVSAIILEQVREADIPIRFGGEEFLVFLICKRDDDPLQFAERLRELVEGAPVVLEDGRFINVTMSGGIAVRTSGESLDEVIRRADSALYRAKAAGRNCVLVAEEQAKLQ